MTQTTTTTTLDQIATHVETHGITRFTDADATDSRALALAVVYAWEYTGRFEYLSDMRAVARRRRTLSAAQARGVLNCALAEIRRRQPATPPETVPEVSPPAETVAPTTPTTGQVANGLYTVVNPDGSHVTLRLAKPKFGDFPEGTQLAAFMAGTYNEGEYTGFAFVKGTRVNVWRRFAQDRRVQDALQVLLTSNDASEYGRAYALASGKCWKCGRTLTTPQSLAAGIGPDCASRTE